MNGVEGCRLGPVGGQRATVDVSGEEERALVSVAGSFSIPCFEAAKLLFDLAALVFL